MKSLLSVSQKVILCLALGAALIYILPVSPTGQGISQSLERQETQIRQPGFTFQGSMAAGIDFSYFVKIICEQPCMFMHITEGNVGWVQADPIDAKKGLLRITAQLHTGVVNTAVVQLGGIVGCYRLDSETCFGNVCFRQDGYFEFGTMPKSTTNPLPGDCGMMDYAGWGLYGTFKDQTGQLWLAQWVPAGSVGAFIQGLILDGGNTIETVKGVVTK